MAGVETDRDFSTAIAGKPMARLLDDIVIGFQDEGSARKALNALRHALWKFNLQLNEEKTAIVPSSRFYQDSWRLDAASLAISAKSPRRLRQDVYRLVDRTLQICEVARTAAPASWACNRLNGVQRITRDNFPVLLDAILRLARDFPSCMQIAAQFVINHQQLCQDAETKERIAAWLRSTMTLNAHRGHDFEQAWCLLIGGVLHISLDEDCLPAPDAIPSGLVLAILGMLRERKLLKVPLSRWKWRAQFNKSGILGSCWLPYYEAVRRGWTTDKAMVNAIKGEPVLAKCSRPK